MAESGRGQKFSRDEVEVELGSGQKRAIDPRRDEMKGAAIGRRQMDWSEVVRKVAILLFSNGGYITLDEFTDLLPPEADSDDVDDLLDALAERGIFLNEEDEDER